MAGKVGLIHITWQGKEWTVNELLPASEFQLVASMLEEPSLILVNKLAISIDSISLALNRLRNQLTTFETLGFTAHSS